ncbi:MAG: hypothetical protein O9303_13185 [Silanimonas sp.]|nr:hypothetical protein [Silanimonas sp.]
MLTLVVLYLYGDDKVLNMPKYFFVIKFTACLIILIIFIYSRFKKFKSYYKKKFKDKIYLTALFVGLNVFSLIFQSFLSIPINFLVKYFSKNDRVEVFDCEITNAITTNIDKIHFKFLNEEYSQYYNINEYEREDLIKNHKLVLKVQPSIFNTYYIKEMNIEKK